MEKSGNHELSWEILEDKHKRPCLKIANRSVESSYNALAQASKTADLILERMQEKQTNFLIIIGLGLGYLAQALHDRGCQNIVFFEPFLQMRRTIPTLGGAWREHYRVVFTSQGLLEELRKKIGDNLRAEVFIHPGYEPYTRFEYRQILDVLRSLYPKTKFEDYRISYRSIESLSRVPFYKTFSTFSQQFTQQTAVLISAGPSIKSALQVLKRAKNCFIFAALQVLPLLQKEGIDVDFVVIADPQDLSGIQKNCHLGFRALLIDSAVHSKSFNWCPDKSWVYNLYTDHLHQLYWEQLPGNNIRAPMSTVSETQLCLAIGMGFEKIVLIGMDYAWKKERYAHRCEQAPKEASYEKRFPIFLADGSLSETEAMYYHGFRFMNYLCSGLKDRVWQYSEGLQLQAANSLDLATLESLLQERVSAKAPIPQVKLDKNAQKIAKELLLKAAHAKHSVQRDLENAFFDSDKYMPFFKEVPVEQRQKLCLEAVDQI